MSHYFDARPQAESRPREVFLRVRGIDLSFETDSGMFSPERIDFGSRLLIEAVAEDLLAAGVKTGRLLDLGCGYGPVGIALKRVFPALEPTLADVNERACALARKNAARNGVKGIEVVVSDAFERLPGPYDVVVTNPPVRAGKDVVHAFFQGAWERLVPGGRLYVVLQRKQGAPSAAEWLEARFGSCDAIEKDAGYRVLRSVRKA